MTKRKKNILVVEDDVLVQTLYQYLLSAQYQLLVASNVSSATKIFEREKIDCVILDLALAGEESGLVLARFIRQDPKNHELPIIAVTAHAFPVDQQNALEAGCDEYMSKPLDANILLKMIEDLLNP